MNLKESNRIAMLSGIVAGCLLNYAILDIPLFLFVWITCAILAFTAILWHCIDIYEPEVSGKI